MRQEGMQVISPADLRIGDVVKGTGNLPWGVCDRNGRDSLVGAEFGGVVYRIDSDEVYVFDWNTETFGCFDKEWAEGNLILIDHKPRSAAKAAKFHYECDSVLADKCHWGHHVTIADDTKIIGWLSGGDRTHMIDKEFGSHLILMARSKCGKYWIACDEDWEYITQIPMTTKVDVHSRDTEVVKNAEWSLIKFPWQEKENIANGYGNPECWWASFEWRELHKGETNLVGM